MDPPWYVLPALPYLLPLPWHDHPWRCVCTTRPLLKTSPQWSVLCLASQPHYPFGEFLPYRSLCLASQLGHVLPCRFICILRRHVHTADTWTGEPGSVPPTVCVAEQPWVSAPRTSSAWRARAARARTQVDVYNNMGDLWRAQGVVGRNEAQRCYGQALQVRGPGAAGLRRLPRRPAACIRQRLAGVLRAQG